MDNMDFFTDFTDLARTEFIGGIDNDALDFEQFMQVAAGVGNLEDSNAQQNNNSSSNNNTNSNNNNGNNSLDLGICNPKVETPTTPPMHTMEVVNNMPLATVSARVSLASTPIATPLAGSSALGSIQTHAHLPESPPDSGSEPPYSPLQDTHGLTLTSRDIYHGLSALQQQQQLQQQPVTPMLQELHMPPQYTPPPANGQQQQLQGIPNGGQQQHHFAIHHMNTPQDGGGIHHSVRVKHETGLIMQPGALIAQQLQQQQQQDQQQKQLVEQQQLLLLQHQHQQHHPQQQQHQHHDTQPTHHTQPQQHQLMYQAAGSSSTTQHFGDLHSGGHGLYAVTSYPNLVGDESPATCMLTSSLGEATRVQVIGTSQASLDRISAPSTPVHSSSRKRKMSTQLDCPDFSHIKHDPAMVMSPLRASHHSLTTHDRPSSHASPPIRLSGHNPSNSTTHNNNSDLPKTPTHSHSSASASPALSTVNSNADNSLDGHGSSSTSGSGGNNGGDQSDGSVLTPCIRFSPFQPENWHKLCDQSLQELSVVYYRVDADKGFNFSVSDDAFVCQKKNHFQVTCHARLQGDAKFVKTPSGLEKIKSFHLHFYGVKLEAPNQTIRVEQSQSDRSKKPFYPVPIDLQSHIVSKITVGRLHFSETTNNNMRKKGRPNPEQRYFQLVVGLHVHTTSGNFPIISQGSERIIVRASNPGQFESDVDLCWQRGLTQDSIFHAGRVGINTDRPDESLVVHGNLKVSGHIVQPSDSRAKQEIGELDTSVQLRNLLKIRIVRYRYEPEFAVHSGLKRASSSDTEDIVDTGVIAQEVREVIPDAVQEAGSIVLPNGNVIENFLLVNKDRILMENIGAVKELSKVTGSLETRIEHLERANSRLTRAKELEQRSMIAERIRKSTSLRDGYEICSSRTLQIIIFLLIIVMAACLAAVSTLYFVEHNKQQHNMKQLESYQVFSNGHIFRPQDTGTSYITDQERHYMQHNLHTLLHKNKTQHSHWPSFMYGTSTSRPPAKNATKTRDELLSYSSSSENYGIHGAANDELRVVMEKPLVQLPAPKSPSYRITTTAPRSNKTVGSKNKSKWPQAQEILRSIAANQAVQKLVQTSRNANIDMGTRTSIEMNSNSSNNNNNETSSDKAPDGLPLSQDFENNSIDMEAQHISRKAVNAEAATSSENSVPIAAVAVVRAANKDTDVTLKLTDHIIVDPIASTSSSNSINVPDTTATAAVAAGQAIRKINTDDAVIYNVYKTVSPPTANLALTTNKVNTESIHTSHNHSQEDAPVVKRNNSNRTKGQDNGDALDLQNLSNTNESVDNPITAVFGFEYLRESSVGRRSATKQSALLVTSKTIKAAVFGEPTECQPHSVQGNNEKCQSLCYEHLTPQNPDDTLVANIKTQKLVQNVDENLDADDEGELIEVETQYQNVKNETQALISATAAHNVPANNVTPKEQVGSASLESAMEHEEHLEIMRREPKAAGDFDSALTANDDTPLKLTPKPETQRLLPTTNMDCWTITSCLLAGQLNSTFDVEHFCPQFGKSLNVTYILPLSEFLQTSSLELHMSSSKPLQWSICNSEEETNKSSATRVDPDDDDDNDDDQSPPTNSLTILKQRNSTKLILALNITQRGYFLHDFTLRASTDLEQQKTCDNNAHITNTILQYNFRIVRDCD